jgi:DNA-binding MarR family transcriptional regulator
MEWEPYADGSSGHQGDASEDAEPSRRSGIIPVLQVVRRSGAYGRTWREVAHELGLHHGQASGALSNLHRSGTIVRLAHRRDRCSVYVVTGMEQGRETRPFKSNPRTVVQEAAPTEGQQVTEDDLVNLIARWRASGSSDRMLAQVLLRWMR